MLAFLWPLATLDFLLFRENKQKQTQPPKKTNKTPDSIKDNYLSLKLFSLLVPLQL